MEYNIQKFKIGDNVLVNEKHNLEKKFNGTLMGIINEKDDFNKMINTYYVKFDNTTYDFLLKKGWRLNIKKDNGMVENCTIYEIIYDNSNSKVITYLKIFKNENKNIIHPTIFQISVDKINSILIYHIGFNMIQC